MLRFICLLSSVLIFSACEKVVINRGCIIESEHFKKIKIGKNSAMEVYSYLGSPTVRSSVVALDGSYSWYYVSKITEKTGFMDPVVIDQKTMVITFDKNSIVKSISESTYEKPVSTVGAKTDTAGKTAGVFSETFGGIGKYMNRYSDDKK